MTENNLICQSTTVESKHQQCIRKLACVGLVSFWWLIDWNQEAVLSFPLPTVLGRVLTASIEKGKAGDADLSHPIPERSGTHFYAANAVYSNIHVEVGRTPTVHLRSVSAVCQHQLPYFVTMFLALRTIVSFSGYMAYEDSGSITHEHRIPDRHGRCKWLIRCSKFFLYLTLLLLYDWWAEDVSASLYRSWGKREVDSNQRAWKPQTINLAPHLPAHARGEMEFYR